MLSNVEREKLVLDLYYNQHKNVRQISQEARMSFRDISIIIKKRVAAVNGSNVCGNENGIAMIDNQQQQQQQNNGNNDNNHHAHSNEKTTQAYRLFTEGYKLVEVAIQLGISEKEATRYYTEYWKLKRLYKLYAVYKELKGDLSPILKLYRLLKREGVRIEDLEWFVHAVNVGTYKIPQIQKQYAEVKDELEDIDYKKTMAKYQLDDLNNLITHTNLIINKKKNEIASLQLGAQELEGYVHGLESNSEQEKD
jgi:hypothetical protein